ncbi:MAG: maturation protein [Hangzhou levivirus 2]|uniref:Maturation protein n=1 Tax=Hangzhou levivirus 2 TaxID=2905508 RepID=A0A8K1XZM8_9VIRU|nr:MAG: maturation protein [Hangzhou levivirus 2]
MQIVLLPLLPVRCNMNKTGLFPTTEYASSGLSAWRKQGNDWVGIDGVSDPEVKSIFANVINSGFESSGFIWDAFFWGATGVSTSGVPTPKPPDKVFNLDKIKVNNHPFQRKVNDGDIVVSPYQIGSCTLSFTNGGEKSDGSYLWAGKDVRGLYYTHGLFQLAPEVRWDAIRLTPNLAVAGAVQFRSWHGSFSDSATPYSVGYFNTNYLHRYLDLVPNNNVVMENLASANTASVDILTAMAEMPETLKSVIDACKTMLRLYNSCKKGEFRLHNKEKQIRISYEQAVADFPKIVEAINRLSISNRAKRARIRALGKQRKQLKAQFKKDIKDIASAISDVWLNFRYNIMPNVYLIEGALEVMHKREEQFFRWTKTANVDLPPVDLPTGWSAEYGEEVQERCFIKRKFEAGYSSGISFNPFLTAWELVPLSFVIDWFVNIGTFAASQLTLLSPQRWQQEGSTYSWIVDASIKWTHLETKASVTHKTKMYRRIVIDPSLYCGFPWTPKMNDYRYYDSIALSWNIALKRLLK